MKEYESNLRRVSYFKKCENDEKIWCSLKDKNAICEIDKMSRQVKILGHFPSMSYSASEVSASCVLNGNKVFFAPYAANEIAIYDIKDRKLRFIPIKEHLSKIQLPYLTRCKFYSTFSYRNYVFMLGIGYPCIIRINADTEEIFYFDEWTYDIKNKIHNTLLSLYFGDECLIFEDNIYMPMLYGNCILKIQPETFKWEMIMLDKSIKGIWGISKIYNRVFVTGLFSENTFFLGEYSFFLI